MDDNNTVISISGEVSGGGDAGTPTTSRWNPTKEQISVLEGLYGQGIRTPSAEQIQQITSRLRAYGHIEGKNVFYWFQNHKARQRQKQKQESMVYINRFPILPSCTNVLCSPFCVPQGGVGMYPQFQKVLLPGGVKRRSKAEKVEKIQEGGSDRNRTGHLQPEFSNSDQFHETLQLFPLHPTGILEGKSENCYSSSSVSTVGSSNLSTEKSIDQPFFNFFGEHGSCEGE